MLGPEVERVSREPAGLNLISYRQFRVIPTNSRETPLPAGGRCMVEPMMIDLKALMVEREDCDAGTCLLYTSPSPRDS